MCYGGEFQPYVWCAFRHCDFYSMTMHILERDPFKQNFRSRFQVWSQMEHLLLSVRLKYQKYLALLTKMAKTIGMIYKPKYCLPKKSLRSFYYIFTCLSFMSLLTLLQPSAGLQLIKPIYVALILVQKRTVQIIDNKDYRARSEPYFKNLKILRRSPLGNWVSL